MPRAGFSWQFLPNTVASRRHWRLYLHVERRYLRQRAWERLWQQRQPQRHQHDQRHLPDRESQCRYEYAQYPGPRMRSHRVQSSDRQPVVRYGSHHSVGQERHQPELQPVPHTRTHELSVFVGGGAGVPDELCRLRLPMSAITART